MATAAGAAATDVCRSRLSAYTKAAARRSDAVRAEQATQGFAAQRESFILDKPLVEMMIVEAGVARACPSEDAVAPEFGQATADGAAVADVCRSRLLPTGRRRNGEPISSARSRRLKVSRHRESFIRRLTAYREAAA